MAVKIRLARHGAKKRPYYRIVVADSRCPRDGKFIEEVGRYNPCTEPAMVQFDLEKVDQWIKNGAQPTDTVASLLKRARENAYASWPSRRTTSSASSSPSCARSSSFTTIWRSRGARPRAVPYSPRVA